MNDELMKPRFKLINDYPGNSQPIGNVTTEVATADYFRKFPANFKELCWGEERKPEDMPEYVKGNVGSFFRVMKVAHPSQNFRLFHIEDEIEHRFAYKGQYEPATKEDYETYLTNNKLNP